MAGRQFCIHPASVTDLTVYTHVFDGVGEFWDGASFDAFNSANWADYWVQMSEYEDSGIYYFDWPSDIDEGVYGWIGRLQASGTLAADSASTDIILGSGGPVCWNGSAIETFLLGTPASHNSILIPTVSGLDMYALVFSDSGLVWGGSALGAWAAGSITDYDVPASELSGSNGIYKLVFPVDLTTPGRYTLVLRSGSVAVGDPNLACLSVDWSGTAIASLHSYLANFSSGRNIPQVYRRVA